MIPITFTSLMFWVVGILCSLVNRHYEKEMRKLKIIKASDQDILI